MKHIVFRIVAGLVMLAALTGLVFLAYGMMTAHSAAINFAATEGIPARPYMPYFWMPFPFFGFACFGLFLPLALVMLAFGAFRRMIWGPRWGWNRMHHGPWGEKGIHPMFAEMHRRAHEAEAAEKKDQPNV